MPREKPGDAAGTGASPAQGEAQTAPEEIPPACVGRGQQHKQLLVSFFPSTCFQGFYLSSADRKAGLERAQPVTSSQQMLLQQRFLAALVGSMLGVRVGSPLPWIIPASLLAEHQASQLWVPAHIPQPPASRATGQHYSLGALEPGLSLD